MSSIELEGIAKSWGDAIALHHVSLRIEPGSFCVLLGPSGCGKSTTLRIIAGLETASAGTLRIDGRDVTALPPAQRGVAMVFQNYALFTVGLQVFSSVDQGVDWSVITAATLMTSAPLLVAFLLFQRQFVQSFMRAGIK